MFYNKILKEIETRNEIEQAAKMFSEFNIASTGQKRLENLEWTGKTEASEHVEEEILDSDDDEDPIKILAQSRVKKVIKVPVERKLITESDLEDIKSFSVPLEPYAVQMIEKNEVDTLPKTEKFKPYKTTKTDVHNPAIEMNRKVAKNWEVTAATPPLLKHPGVKMLSLHDSVQIQIKYAESLRVRRLTFFSTIHFNLFLFFTERSAKTS